jgi:hypothetical protein
MVIGTCPDSNGNIDSNTNIDGTRYVFKWLGRMRGAVSVKRKRKDLRADSPHPGMSTWIFYLGPG